MISAIKRHRKPIALAAAFATSALFVPAASVASAQSKRDYLSAETILRNYVESGRSLNLRGTETVIVQHPGGRMLSTTRQITHSSDGVTLTKWIDPADQRGLTVLDDGTWSKRYHPREGLTKVSRSTPRARDAKTAARIARLILRNYHVRLEGIAPMAGRKCYKLLLTPVHPISNTVRLWIDRENWALLSHMESTARTTTLSVAQFNGVEFPKRISGAELRKAIPAKAKQESFSRSEALSDFEQVRKRVGFEFCPPYSMPGGYEFQSAEVLSLKGVTTTCVRYSDGIGEITICQNRATEQRPAQYQSTQPMVDAMGNNIVDHKVGQMNFFLVGRCQMAGLLAVTNALDTHKERVFLGYLARNYSIPLETLAGFRNRGIGLDTLDALLAISRDVRKPLSALVNLCRDGYGWAAVGRRFRADVGRILKHVRTFECR